MLKILNRIIKVGDRIYASLAVVLLAVLVISVSAGITARYFFNSPFDWTEELVTLLFIWISFLSAAVAAARHKLVIVDFFIAKIPPSGQAIIGVMSDILSMVFLAMIIIGSVILIPQMVHPSVALNIPKSVYYLAVFVSSILIFLVQLESLLLRLGALLKKNKQEVSP